MGQAGMEHGTGWDGTWNMEQVGFQDLNPVQMQLPGAAAAAQDRAWLCLFRQRRIWHSPKTEEFSSLMLHWPSRGQGSYVTNSQPVMKRFNDKGASRRIRKLFLPGFSLSSGSGLRWTHSRWKSKPEGSRLGWLGIVLSFASESLLLLGGMN